MTALRDALERTAVPDAHGARTRGWALAADAYARARPAASGRRRARVAALALAAVLLAAAVAVAAEPPRWVRHMIGAVEAPAPRVTLGPLPQGRLLVSSPRGTWIVHADGTRSRLGPWTGATWSPHGLYVGAWRGRELSAVAPDGRVAWTIAALGVVRDVAWSPDGYRVAYRRDGALAVVAGDGTGPRVLAAPVRAVAPAWRPGAPHTLAWVGASGRVEVRDIDSGALVWRSAAAVGAVRDLAWSADGERLAAWRPRRLVVVDVHGNRVRRVTLSPGTRVAAVAWAPSGRRLALVLRSGTASRVVVATGERVPRQALLATPGTLGSPAWSPDGRRLLVRWREADQWLLLPADGAGRVTAIAGVSRRFGGTAPTVRGWCCAR